MFAFRGATIGELTYQIEKNQESIDGYPCMIIHVGTNDVNRLTVNQFMSAYCNLISTVKSLFPNMIIGFSGILPRPTDFEKTNEKVFQVNMDLQRLCEKYKIHFIHAYRYFMKFGKPLVELFACRDGLHLNREGTKQLGSYFKRRVAHFYYIYIP